MAGASRTIFSSGKSGSGNAAGGDCLSSEAFDTALEGAAGAPVSSAAAVKSVSADRGLDATGWVAFEVTARWSSIFGLSVWLVVSVAASAETLDLPSSNFGFGVSDATGDAGGTASAPVAW